jgi:hypothetical protein
MKTIIRHWTHLAVSSHDEKCLRQKLYRQSKHIPCSTTPPPPPENRAVYGVIWKNILESCRPHDSMADAFSLQQWCTNTSEWRLNVTVYFHCLSCHFPFYAVEVKGFLRRCELNPVFYIPLSLSFGRNTHRPTTFFLTAICIGCAIAFKYRCSEISSNSDLPAWSVLVAKGT